MDRVTSRAGRRFVHFVLISFTVYSLVPFIWTGMQSFKTVKDAFSRTPLLLFEPTLQNYQEVWIRRVPENAEAIGLGILLAVVVLVGAAVERAQFAYQRSPGIWILPGGFWIAVVGDPAADLYAEVL